MARIKVLRFSGDGSTLIPTAAFTSSEMFTVAKHSRLDDAFLNASQGVGSVWGLTELGGIDGRAMPQLLASVAYRNEGEKWRCMG